MKIVKYLNKYWILFFLFLCRIILYCKYWGIFFIKVFFVLFLKNFLIFFNWMNICMFINGFYDKNEWWIEKSNLYFWWYYF